MQAPVPSYHSLSPPVLGGPVAIPVAILNKHVTQRRDHLQKSRSAKAMTRYKGQREASEGDAVDLITDALYSVGFLQGITDQIFSTQRDALTVGQFYDQWLKNAGAPRAIIPFNPGMVLAILYVGILFAKENWFELVPDEPLEKTADWGLNEATPLCPLQPSPTLQYVVRRLRNSLGHGYPRMTIPKGTKREQAFSKTTVEFHDEDPKKPSDTFDVSLNMNQLVILTRKFHEAIHRHVRQKQHSPTS